MACTSDRSAGYTLLPFQFMRLDGRTLVVNQAGEYHLLTNSAFERFVNHALGACESVFRDLKAKHFLADGNLALPIQLLATKYRTKKAFLRNFTGLHMIVLTVRCNQKCTYCQVASENADASRFDMQPVVASKAVELIFQSPSPYIKIEFQGGEPFLNFETMQHVVELAESLNNRYKKHLQFVACTNLANISEAQLLFCRDHGILISTSLDGPRDLHDACRLMEDGSGSYSRVIQGIRLARDIVGLDRVSALMTATRASMGRFTEVVDEYLDNGFRAVFFRTVNPYGRARTKGQDFCCPVEDFVTSYKEGLEHIIRANIRGQFFAEQYATLVLARMLTPFSTGFVDLQSPAGAGIGCAVYDYDGGVYVSDEGRMLARAGDSTFRMGNVLTDAYRTMFGGDVIRRTVSASCVECLPECCDCAFQMWCGADPVRNFSTQGDMVGHRPSSEFCIKNKAIIRYLFDKMDGASPEIQDVFWSWITSRSLDEVRSFGDTERPCDG